MERHHRVQEKTVGVKSSPPRVKKLAVIAPLWLPKLLRTLIYPIVYNIRSRKAYVRISHIYMDGFSFMSTDVV